MADVTSASAIAVGLAAAAYMAAVFVLMAIMSLLRRHRNAVQDRATTVTVPDPHRAPLEPVEAAGARVNVQLLLEFLKREAAQAAQRAS